MTHDRADPDGWWANLPYVRKVQIMRWLTDPARHGAPRLGRAAPQELLPWDDDNDTTDP